MSQLRTVSLGIRSRSESALKLCAYASMKPVRVWPIPLSCNVGFKKKVGTNDHHDKMMCRKQGHVARL